MKKTKICLLPILFLPMFLTGCWDNVEINERHVVLEIALDKNMEVDTAAPVNKQKRYDITYTIPDIGKLSGEDSIGEDVKTVLKTQTPTIATSIDEVETKSQNTISFSHTKALVLGEDLLKDTKLFKQAIDALVRDVSISRDVLVIAVKGKASDLTESQNPQNPIIGLYMMKYFNNAERPASYAKNQTLGQMLTELEDTGVTTIPQAVITEEGGIQISGAALIKNYDFVDWLSKQQVRGELFVEGKVNKAPVTIDYKGRPLTYTVQKQKSRITFDEIDGRWAANIKLSVYGDITEYTADENDSIFRDEILNEIAKHLQQEINNEVTVAIDKSKAENVDFLNIGLEMYRKHPKVWNQYKVMWEIDGYKAFPIELSTEVTIQNTGVIE